MTSLSTIVAAFLAVFLASVTGGLMGFGFALVSVPLLILCLPLKSAVSVVWLLGSVSDVVILLSARKHAQPRRIWPLMVGGIVGIQLGAYLLILWDVNTLKVFIGAVIAASALAFLFGFKKQVQNEGLACLPVGLASGLLGGSTGMSGPPVILFFANQGIERLVFRANLATYFVVIGAARVPSYLLGGLLTREVLAWTALLLPALGPGTWLGIKLVSRIDEKLFRKAALLILIAAGLASVASGLGLM